LAERGGATTRKGRDVNRTGLNSKKIKALTPEREKKKNPEKKKKA